MMSDHGTSPLRSLSRALAMAVAGTLLFYLVGRILLKGLVGDAFEVAGCLLGSTMALWVFARGDIVTFRRALPPSLAVVGITFLSIAGGHALSSLAAQRVVGLEPINLLFWAIVTTGWWLVPGVAGAIVAVNRSSAAREAVKKG